MTKLPGHSITALTAEVNSISVSRTILFTFKYNRCSDFSLILSKQSSHERSDVFCRLTFIQLVSQVLENSSIIMSRQCQTAGDD